MRRDSDLPGQGTFSPPAGENTGRRSRFARGRLAGPVVCLGLFVIALVPRAINLGAFATADEAKWVYRSARFLAALLQGDLAGTVVNLTPAVTTTWLGSLGLAGYHALHKTQLALPLADWLLSLPEFRADLDVLVAVRWPMVLLTSLGVVAFYLLARRLVDDAVALLFGLALALDPHFIALSRVIGHDAPAGLFVGLSLLAVLAGALASGTRETPGSKPSSGVASFNPWSRYGRWLLLSGALAGLACLSKSPAFFLVPFVGLVTLVGGWRRGENLWAWLRWMVLWGFTAWFTFVAFWPAAWIDPLGAPYAVIHNAFLSATDVVESAAEGYWSVPDLGWAYYLVNGIFKISPLAALGLLGWPAGWPAHRSRERLPVKTSHLAWWLLAFVVLFTLFMTLGGKRSNRYLLPAWPALYLLAAMGLVFAVSRLRRGLARSALSAGAFSLILPAALAALLALPPLAVYPYYLTYLNPLVGGPLFAPRLIKIGWGEGLDQAGRWLEALPDAPALRVGVYYASAMSPYFSGGISSPVSGQLDYVVSYIKQDQSGEPSPTILRYFDSRWPAYRVRLDGVEYARIFEGPAMQVSIASQLPYDAVILPRPLAFRPDVPYLPIGQDVAIEVLWLAGELPDAPARLTLQALETLEQLSPGGTSVWAESDAFLKHRAADVVVSRHILSLPEDLPRGSYGLLVDGRPLGRVEARRLAPPNLERRLDAGFGGQLSLLGYNFDPHANNLELVWQADPLAWADYTLFLHLVDVDGNRVAGVDGQPPVPTSSWDRNEVMSVVYSEEGEPRLPLPADLPPGDYRLTLGLYSPHTGKRLEVVDASGNPLGDSLTLPLTLEIE